MMTYPVMLDVRGRKVVVIGGGRVGMRKARPLLEAGADVTLITEQIPEDGDLSGVTVICKPYRPELLTEASLVFACTDDCELNARIAADARTAGALVNVVDDPDRCDFFSPAMFRDGDVVIAVGTGGSCPRYAAVLRDRLSVAIPRGAGEFAALLGKLRKTLKARVRRPARRAEIIKKLAGQDTFELFRKSGEGAVKNMLDEWIGGG